MVIRRLSVYCAACDTATSCSQSALTAQCLASRGAATVAFGTTLFRFDPAGFQTDIHRVTIYNKPPRGFLLIYISLSIIIYYHITRAFSLILEIPIHVHEDFIN